MTDSELATAQNPDDAYLAVASDIMQIIELRKDIVSRLETAVRRKGSDPLNLRAALNEVAATQTATAAKRASSAPRRGEKALVQAVYEFAKSQGEQSFTLADAKAALEAQDFRPQSVSPALSNLLRHGVVERVTPEGVTPSRFLLSEKGKAIVIKPGFQLTEKALQRIGELRGQAA